MQKKSDFSLSLVQFEPKFLDFHSNLDRMLTWSDSENADIVVFPELALSGYNFNDFEEAKSVAVPANTKKFDGFSAISREKERILCFGFAELYEDKLFNSAILFLPDGTRKIYRKTHLFYKETEIFEPGDTGFNVFKYEPWDINIGMMVCYDWRFPESARSLGLRGADLILCPSNLVTDVWHISMPSRALENKLYLATCNRIGTEKNKTSSLFFTGESGIYGYNGKLLAKASIENEEIIRSRIEPQRTRNKAFNEINDIFSDRRPELYI
jgi:predicted amidohydrolase